MDFDLNADQRRLLDSVDKIIDSVGGVDRAQAISRRCEYDGALDTALSEQLDMSSTRLLERALVAETLAQRGTATTFGMRAILGSEIELPPGAIAITDYARSGPVRFLNDSASLVLLDGANARVVPGDTFASVPVQSSYGFPYGQFDRSDTDRTVQTGNGNRIRSLWRLAVAAEISGNAAMAIAATAEHLRSRNQFGKPLAQLQALRHRLADACVTAEAIRWMVRETSFFGDVRGFDLTAAYAADRAGGIVPDLVQMCGARSFTKEFGLQVYAMRMTALRLELGAEDVLANAVLAHQWEARWQSRLEQH
ncbi:acyl-CoA dehydrogenase family protein [Mycobacterium sp. 236(2023)]|uniref:acyl-CoA dehydrogenase family protein n=1 Tax=Mycobacterium sp. 236(2023) TaxID=3038163 RepID=UPI002414E9A5|nr:acyl-CoA dehydrogenase family protein [Mycobacterium sp. 236(2023)]MDG4668054.1 acyl-CoA dehydrogenase family protein [Mycobacterium sp. 236(2023)]